MDRTCLYTAQGEYLCRIHKPTAVHGGGCQSCKNSSCKCGNAKSETKMCNAVQHEDFSNHQGGDPQPSFEWGSSLNDTHSHFDASQE